MKPVKLNPRNVEEQINKNLNAILNELPQFKCMVGIAGGKQNKGNDIAHYAKINEFGSISNGIPSRPFLRSTFKGERLRKIQKSFQRLLKNMAASNGSAALFLEKAAMYTAGEVKRNVTEGKYKPNKPSTIRRKGSSTPLIDTGTMRRAITGWITKAGKK